MDSAANIEALKNEIETKERCYQRAVELGNGDLAKAFAQQRDDRKSALSALIVRAAFAK